MLPIQIVLPHPSQPFKTTSPRSVDVLQRFTLFTHLLMKTAFLYTSMHFYIFTFCNTLSWFIRLVSWNSIKGIKYFSSSTETKLGTGWFPFCCSCSVVIVIIFQVPRQNKLYNKKKGKIPFISLTFSWHLSDFPSQMKVKNVPTYPPHFPTFSALVDRHAAPLSCSDIFLLSFFHYSVCSAMTQNRKVWKRSNLSVSQPCMAAIIHPNRKFKTSLWMDVTEVERQEKLRYCGLECMWGDLA